MLQVFRWRTRVSRCSDLHRRCLAQIPLRFASSQATEDDSQPDDRDVLPLPNRPPPHQSGEKWRATDDGGSLAESPWVRLRELPRTALTSDISNAVWRTGVNTKFEIYLDYSRFLPSGTAFLKFESHEAQRDALKRIGGRRFQVSGLDIVAQPANPDVQIPDRMVRSRGFKGRAKAVARGIVDGEGFRVVTERARSVVIWGLPGKLDVDGLKASLKEFHLRTRFLEDGVTEDPIAAAQTVVKMHPAPRSLTSRFLVRLQNQTEAHRLVRRLHMTYWDKHLWDTKYQIRAHVVY